MSDLFAGIALSKREAEALVEAHRVLAALEDRARSLAYGQDVKSARVGGIVSERADAAQDALSSVLIALEVHGETKRARRALDALHAVAES